MNEVFLKLLKEDVENILNTKGDFACIDKLLSDCRSFVHDIKRFEDFNFVDELGDIDPSYDDVYEVIGGYIDSLYGGYPGSVDDVMSYEKAILSSLFECWKSNFSEGSSNDDF